MRKEPNFQVITILMLICYLLSPTPYGCGSDKTNEGGMPDSLAMDTAKVQPQLPKPPENKTVNSIVSAQMDKSPFKNIGCCTDENLRSTEDCCCAGVLEEYKKLRAKNDVERIAQLKKEDPILGYCRKKLKKAFELVDYPPPPPGKKQSTDDLF